MTTEQKSLRRRWACCNWRSSSGMSPGARIIFRSVLHRTTMEIVDQDLEKELSGLNRMLYPSRLTIYNCICWNILGDNCTGTDHGVFADSDAG